MKSLILLLMLVLVGCASPQKVVIDRPFDTTPAWTKSDAKTVAENLVNDMLSFPWLTGFQQQYGKKPTVLVVQPDNQTGELLDTEGFRQALIKPLSQADQVQTLAQQAQAADFNLQARIKLQLTQTEWQRVSTYQVELDLVDNRLGKSVWSGKNTFQKVQTKSRIKP